MMQDNNNQDELAGDGDDAAYNNRERIYEFIERNPGTHLRKIIAEFGLAMGHTQYHLNILEKSGRIKSTKSSLHRYYYPAAIVDGKYEVLLAFLRQETATITKYLITLRYADSFLNLLKLVNTINS
jgi:predicted transcriptional regulator